MTTPRKAAVPAKRAVAKRTPPAAKKTAMKRTPAARKAATASKRTAPTRKRSAAKKVSPLRAVTAADAQAAAATAAAQPDKPKTISQAADTGTHRELLVATRARIAMAVESVHTPPRDLAALTRRLMEIAREIESIDAAAKQEADESVELDDEEFDPQAL